VTASNQYLAIRFINEDEKSSWQSHLPIDADFACICNVATECGINKKLILEVEHFKRQIFIDDAVVEDMLSVAGRQICHPYWKFYAQLASLETAKLAPSDLKDKVKYLMLTVGLDFKERLKLNAMMNLPCFKVRMIEESFFRILRERFAYSVWSPQILQFVSAYSPLIELGAGNGYNAWLLEQLGATVIALDPYPIEEGRNWFFNTKFGLPSRTGKSWTAVQKGTSEELLKYPDHTLLLCWPPINRMGVEALSNYPGKRIIFIGHKKCCATSSFYKKLEIDWKLEYAATTGSWNGCHTEWLEVYTRKLAES
jgi:hypothetical protein